MRSISILKHVRLLVPAAIASFALLAAFAVASPAAGAATAAAAPAVSAPSRAAERLDLRDGWTLQSSRKIKSAGEAIAAKGFSTADWYRTSVPSTVLAVQVAAGEFKDPFRGMNLRKIPGTSYPIGFNSFSNLPMPKDSPYAVSWWYRTEFDLPKSFADRRAWLHFGGINYRANIWVNGHKVADSKDVQGAYRIYEFDVTPFVRPGEANVLAVETFAPNEKQLGINWVDWNPAPPDKDMGIWGDVFLTSSGPVSVRHGHVVTNFSDSTLKQADLTVMAELTNATDAPVKGVAEVLLDNGAALKQDVDLKPHESQRVVFVPEKFAALHVKNPKVWWPVEMGTPNLHTLRVRFTSGGHLSDEHRSRFGIREAMSELTKSNYRLFKINRRSILIRGAGWSQDMLMRQDRQRLEAQLQYALDMHLNTIRLEAQLEVDEFFDIADEKGLLVMAGWCCCDAWEKWKDWVPGTLDIATTQLRTQMLRMRSHPAMMAWLNGSDGPPPADVEAAYIKVEREAAWPNAIVSSASDVPTTVSGPSGVKMSGPYDYEPPSYWLTDERKRLKKGQGLDSSVFGGAYGFNTETGPGAAIPPLESLKKMLPPDHLWPIDEVWGFHGAGERFTTMKAYRTAMDNTYGKPATLEDFLRKSQAMAYDGERAMFEAHGRNKYEATGVVQWMFNNAWPSTFWHLFDYYLYPAGAYFGTKKANEFLHVQYSYDDRSVAIVNSRQEAAKGLTVSAKVYDFALKQIFAKDAKVEIPADGVVRAFTVPEFPAAPPSVYFVKLALKNAAGRAVSENFYWLPSKLSTLDWDKTIDTAVAPVRTFEDLTALAKLPAVNLSATASHERVAGKDRVKVTLRNSTQSLAFQVHVGVRAPSSDQEILPVLWEDNYLSLLPGESRTVTADFFKWTPVGPGATVVVDGWNITPTTVPLSPKH